MINRFYLIAVLALSYYVVKTPIRVAPKHLASSVSKNKEVESLAYTTLNANQFPIPSLAIFSTAIEGFNQLKAKGIIQSDYLTIIDYSMPSTSKRLWVIDTDENKVILNSLVAHGKNSGLNYANSFSNKNESNKSSLGFFATGETYIGKHGLSLKLDGLEKGINNNARERAIVIHGADYVSTNFIRDHNRLGLSHGCPALPINLSSKIIQIIKGKSCLFIYHPSRNINLNSDLVS